MTDLITCNHTHLLAANQWAVCLWCVCTCGFVCVCVCQMWVRVYEICLMISILIIICPRHSCHNIEMEELEKTWFFKHADPRAVAPLVIVKATVPSCRGASNGTVLFLRKWNFAGWALWSFIGQQSKEKLLFPILKKSTPWTFCSNLNYKHIFKSGIITAQKFL